MSKVPAGVERTPGLGPALNLDAPTFAGGLHFSGPKVEGGVKGGQVGLQGPGLSMSGPQGHLESGSEK